MLSRRNIRIKVLQSLYMMGRDPQIKKDDAITFYKDSLEQSRQLYLFNIFILLRTAECAVQDAHKRLTKYLPSDEDKQFSDKLYNNRLISGLNKEVELGKILKSLELKNPVDKDLINRLYRGFSKVGDYGKYMARESDDSDHVDMLLILFKYLVKNDDYDELMHDHFPTWEDDKSLIVGALKKTIKALPEDTAMFKEFKPDYEAGIEFGEALLNQVASQETELEKLIESALQNWELDRVAAIDMILLKMALMEFMECPTIPTKVTLNEYVEISKIYSTDKSKDFINGILDNLMKQLSEEGRIKKEGRGLVE